MKADEPDETDNICLIKQTSVSSALSVNICDNQLQKKIPPGKHGRTLDIYMMELKIKGRRFLKALLLQLFLFLPGAVLSGRLFLKRQRFRI